MPQSSTLISGALAAFAIRAGAVVEGSATVADSSVVEYAAVVDGTAVISARLVVEYFS